MPAISVSTFINPPRKSREHNAICRADSLPLKVRLIGEYEGERYYRVPSSHIGDTPYVVVRWCDPIQGEVVRCECSSHRLKPWPEPCWHVAKVLIYEATESPKKLASMGRKDSDEKRRETKIDVEGQRGRKSRNVGRSRDDPGGRDALNHYDSSAVALRK